MASLSNIGLGSNGALSYDIIEKLQAVDTTSRVSPIERNIEKNTTMSADLSVLTTLTASFKSATSTLADDITYLRRSSNVTGSSATINASAGTSIQNFSLDVTSLAKQDIIESNSFTNESSTFATLSDTITINIDGEDYDIDVDSSTSLTELRDKINDGTEGKVIASVLNVGGSDPYKLILKSTDTGEDQSISMTSTGDAVKNLGLADNYNYTAGTPTGTYTGTDTMTFTINGTDHTLNVADGDSIDEINTKINDLDLSDELSSTIVDGQLILKSNDENFAITPSASLNTFGLDVLGKTSNTDKIQEASNANFSYNGITVSRTQNTIDDLIIGVDITLVEAGLSNISITQDTTDIVTELESFAAKYNELISNLNESTKYDTESKTSGTFQGVSQITTMKSTINRELLSIDAQGRSLESYGISLNEAGMLEFDQTEFDSKMSADPDDVKDFFAGSTTYDTTLSIGSTVSAGSIDFATTDFNINGTNIEVTLNGTASENAIALKNAINSADVYGVEAVLDDSNTYVTLKSTMGEDIEIQGDSAKLASIGFSETYVRGQSETTTGVFTSFNELLNSLAIGNSSILGIYEQSLSDEGTSLEAERLKTVESIEAKYQTMAARFIAYDSIIGKLNAQFSSLSMMIESSYAK